MSSDASNGDGNETEEAALALFNMFPFLFLPVVILVAVFLAIVLPYVRGVSSI